MPDDYFAQPVAPPSRRGSGRTMFVVALLALMLGAAAVAWLTWSGKLGLGGDAADSRSAAQAMSVEPLLAQSGAPAAAATAPVSPAPTPDPALPYASALDQRLAALEQRITRLDLRAEAAAGNAGRAEGLLIAFATRRALERGTPLGYLEDQLRLRFAAAQPAAVEQVIAAARQPVTLDWLVGELDLLAPRLGQTDASESGWSRFRREVGDLFTIRSDAAASVDPAARLERAKLLLRSGQVDAAVAEVQRLPGSKAAADWSVAARRFGNVQRALELIETTAILEPHKLQDGAGDKVEQPSPVAPAI